MLSLGLKGEPGRTQHLNSIFSLPASGLLSEKGCIIAASFATSGLEVQKASGWGPRRRWGQLRVYSETGELVAGVAGWHSS